MARAAAVADKWESVKIWGIESVKCDWILTIQTTARVAVVADKEKCGARGRMIDMYLIKSYLVTDMFDWFWILIICGRKPGWLRFI